MEDKRDIFTYTYSAKEQEEIRNIRQKYLPKEEDKLARLRRLDQGVTRKGAVVSLLAGVSGCLLLGVGMCCTMVWMKQWFILGVALGITGIASVAAAYPLYTYITKKERKRLAPLILKLTEELSSPE